MSFPLQETIYLKFLNFGPYVDMHKNETEYMLMLTPRKKKDKSGTRPTRKLKMYI